MKTLSKIQASYLVLDAADIKTTCKKTNETYSSLRARGYKTAGEIAELQIPSSYVFSAKEGRLFFCTMTGCAEVLKAAVRGKGVQIF